MWYPGRKEGVHKETEWTQGVQKKPQKHKSIISSWTSASEEECLKQRIWTLDRPKPNDTVCTFNLQHVAQGHHNLTHYELRDHLKPCMDCFSPKIKLHKMTYNTGVNKETLLAVTHSNIWTVHIFTDDVSVSLDVQWNVPGTRRPSLLRSFIWQWTCVLFSPTSSFFFFLVCMY